MAMTPHDLSFRIVPWTAESHEQFLKDFVDSLTPGPLDDK